MTENNLNKLLERERRDFYNRKGKYFILTVIAVWMIVYLISQHKLVHLDQDLYAYSSADTRLLMHTNQPFPTWSLTLHAGGAVILLISTFAQKHLVFRAFDGKQANAVQYRRMHRLTGYIALAAALLMDFAGYYMGRFSKLKNFDNFVIGFASPWVLIAIGVLVTAKFLKYYKWHQFFGNMMFKACIAVPLARIFGAILQRILQAGIDVQENSIAKEQEANLQIDGYYIGIGIATAIIGVWQIIDLFSNYLNTHERSAEQSEKNKVK